MNFTFDEKTHTYTLDGKRMTGVTTVLDVLSKPLTQWAANCAVDYIEEKGQKLKGEIKVTAEDLTNARNAWKVKRDTAADKGTDIHAEVEALVRLAIKEGGYMTVGKTDNKQLQNFIDWATSNNIKFLDSEKRIYSKDWWTAGTCDLIFEQDGEVYVGDIKTGKAIYPSMWWQVSAYAKMLIEMGLYSKIKGFKIIRLGKDGSFEVGENYSYDDNVEGFEACLTIYRKLNLIK
jgi:hypothetical protein